MRQSFLQIFCRNLFSLIALFGLFQFGAALIAQPKTDEIREEKKISLKEYSEEIKAAGADLSSMQSLTKKDFEGWSKQAQLDFEKNLYESISKRLPARENIEWQDGEIEVDNRWLHARLEDLKKLPAGSKERDPIVTELRERLSAIGAKLQEVEDSTAAANRNKDEEKQKLAQILNRPEYQAPEKKEKGALERWWESFSKWLKSIFPSPEPMQPIESKSGSGIPPEVVQALIVGTALAIIVFVIWRFAPTFRNRRRRKKESKDSGDRIILGERLAANESSSSLFAQAESMARDGNFRGAIRKGYVALLCELGDRKVVRLEQHKTNRDYLRDVSKDKELHRGVGELTSIFEDHWYGLSSASEEDWGAFRESYRYSTGKF
ncbi:MAG TPA: DUF4129 domain-containing protein [Pyrinomonadaceae bacterium]|jgi:hypothetical protein|nr:DUF4129 domain-containing protein [Pyrinomonadaceae bacterium]